MQDFFKLNTFDKYPLRVQIYLLSRHLHDKDFDYF